LTHQKEAKILKKHSLLHKILWGFTLFISVPLLFIYITPFVSPKLFFLPSILNLLYLPLTILLLFTLVTSIILKYKKLLFFTIFIAALGINHHIHNFGIYIPQCSKNNNNIKLMTYNVKVFNLYNWTKNVEYKKNIIHLIDSVKPDILCIQEYVYDDRNVFNTRDTIIQLLKYKHFSETFLRSNKYFHFGMALFSQYPIIDTQKIVFNSSLNFVTRYKLVLPKNDTVCLFNVHFQSIRFSYNEYKYLDSIKKNIEEKNVKEFLPIAHKIIKANKIRAMQVDSIVKLIDNCKYKTILCGDFNDMPCSYSYKLMNTRMKDAFLHGGFGFGATFNRFFIPYRIDYVFLPNSFNVSCAKVIKKTYSDHYPLIVKFKQE
jgi:vancomycin resistance protein VanJ